MHNLFGDPPTKAEIEAKRRELSIEVSPGTIAMFVTPIPVVDMLVGLAVDGVDHAIRGDRKAELRDAYGALKRDWSASWVARKYVEKVRAMDRELTNGEVSALETQIAIEKGLINAAGAACSTVCSAVGCALENAVKGAVTGKKK